MISPLSMICMPHRIRGCPYCNPKTKELRMKMSSKTRFDKARSFWTVLNRFSMLLAMAALCLASINFHFLTKENSDLKARIQHLVDTSQVAISATPTAESCTAWWMNSDIEAARKRICTSVVKRVIDKKGK
jgi:hypothetical protein